jgi:hypothetical protein
MLSFTRAPCVATSMLSKSYFNRDITSEQRLSSPNRPYQGRSKSGEKGIAACRSGRLPSTLVPTCLSCVGNCVTRTTLPDLACLPRRPSSGKEVMPFFNDPENTFEDESCA